MFKQKSIIKLPLFLVLLFISISLFSQKNSIKFTNYSIKDGLSQSYITDILEDEYGFMWFATQDGLNRFDGRRFLVFKNTPEDTTTILSNYVTTICEDKNGQIWAGTEKGISIYDPKHKEFVRYKTNKKSPGNINIIRKDSKGNMWIGTERQGLFYHDFAQNKLISIRSERFFPALWNVKDIQFDDESNIWIVAENKGLFKIEIQPNLKITKLDIKSFSNIKKIQIDNDRRMIFFCSDTGLGTITFKDGKPTVTDKIFSESFKNYRITNIFLDKEVLWISTSGSGLFRIKNGKTEQFMNVPSSNYSLVSDNVNKVFLDSYENIWIATHKGLSKFDKIKQNILYVTINENLSHGLITRDVWSFCEEKSTGNIWLGSNKGVSYFDRQKNRFKHYFIGSGEEDNSVIFIYEIERNRLLLGTINGLFLIEVNGDQSTTTQVFFMGDETIPANNERVYGIVPFKNKLLIAARNGIILTDKNLQEFKIFSNTPYGDWQKEGGAKYVFSSEEGKTYIAPGIKGLYEVVPTGNDSLYFSPVYEELPVVFQSRMISIAEDKKHFWVGTYGSGLVKVDKLTWEVRDVFSESHGLANNVIYGTLIDSKGDLWMSTNRGISRLNPNTRVFTNFSETDGLQSEEFNAGAFLKATDGHLFFGGINGFNYFSPEDIKKNTIPAKPVLIEMSLFGKKVKPRDGTGLLDESIENVKEIQLKYYQNNITFQYAALHYSNPQKNLFKVKMEGLDEDYLVSDRDNITYSGIPSGEYTLIIYASNSDLIWSSPLKITIIIAPPFWGTLWFRITLIAILALAALVFYRYRINSIRNQKIKLELLIVERTREITQQNKKIQEQKRHVEKQKQKIEEQKKLLEFEKKKADDLLLNILPETTAHELRDKGKSSPRGYKKVTVMFTDFVGFSTKSEGLKPTELIQKLDGYFSKFDQIIGKFHIEKIKTIGDAYMCAGGLPIRNKENPIETVLAGLQIQDYMNTLKEKAIKENKQYWELRLGVHTGEVVAGVIGTKRFAYDIWGNTVNLASRMEMHGEPGKVNVSEKTFSLVEPYFEYTHRGKIKTKHKGYIDMYFIDRIKPELSKDEKGLIPNDKFWEIVNLHLFSSINYLKAERHIMNLLQDSLPKTLHYHSIEHTKDVTKAAERLAIMEGITDEGLFLLKSAATYHDAGFIRQYDKNEPIGIELANDILPRYGYTKEQIDVISELIYATIIPHNPKNLLQQIICDADLDYLGRDDFHEIADKLRLELREHGKINSDRMWDEIQIKFLEQHRYFTKSAIKLRKKKKIQHIEEIKERLKTHKYKD